MSHGRSLYMFITMTTVLFITMTWSIITWNSENSENTKITEKKERKTQLATFKIYLLPSRFVAPVMVLAGFRNWPCFAASPTIWEEPRMYKAETVVWLPNDKPVENIITLFHSLHNPQNKILVKGERWTNWVYFAEWKSSKCQCSVSRYCQLNLKKDTVGDPENDIHFSAV